jgi:hypothetical protein
MPVFLHRFRLYLATGALLLAGCTPFTTPEAVQPDAPTPIIATPAATTVPNIQISDVELLGVITIPNDTVTFDTIVGGLSAITYDSESDAYYFLSDDRATVGPTRIYQTTINFSDGTLDDGDLTWIGMIPLLDESGAPFAQGAIDPEGLVLAGENFYVSTEGDLSSQPPIAPAIIEFTPTGNYVTSLPLPDNFMPTADGSRGVRNNQGLESLTRTPDGRYLISGVENALAQDGPGATLEETSPSRILTIDLATSNVISEQVYIVEPIPVAPNPATGDADNGLVELIVLDNQGTLLAMERSYAEGVGNTVRLYLASTAGATNVKELDALVDVDNGGVIIDAPIVKELVVDFGELGSAQGIAPDNLEGMVWGPTLPDGRQLLLVVSDNNFNPGQTTQLWALALTID